MLFNELVGSLFLFFGFYQKVTDKESQPLK